MDEKTEGLILRTIPLTETSLIVHWLTPDWGRINTVAKGARRPKSTFAGKLDLFYQHQFVFLKSRRSTLHSLKEVQLQQTHPHLREDLLALKLACAAAEFICLATETDTPIPELYQALCSFLQQLKLAPIHPELLLVFEIKALHFLGLSPLHASQSLNAGEQAWIRQAIDLPWEKIGNLRASPSQRSNLNRLLERLTTETFSRFPKKQTALMNPR